VLALLVAVVGVSACSNPTPDVAPRAQLSPPAVKVPFTATYATASGVVAIVAMGILSEPLNTFWQVFFRPDTTARWTLVTPPGVADNGGLVASPSPTAGDALLVGVEPSQDLHYSPLALSANGGNSWSTGLVPAGLAPVPDALALSSGAGSLALVRSDGGEVLRSNGDTTEWSELVGRSTLASSGAGRSCGLGPLTAVALDGTGGPLVGTTCTSKGVVGIFGSSGGGWHLVGPRLSGRSGSAPTRVVRLDDTTGADASRVTEGLVAVGDRSTTDLVAVAGVAAGSWTRSPPLAMDRHGRIVSTGIEPGGGFVVLTSQSNGSLALDAETGPGGAWQRLPPPPRYTAAVAMEPGGVVAALAVAPTVFTDWRLDPQSGTWSSIGTVKVPIQFGSSS
jgi:hypothetical protein